MNFLQIIFLISLGCACVTNALASREVIGLLDNASDLTADEVKALLPLFVELQTQYDHIVSEIAQDVADRTHTANAIDNALYESTMKEFQQSLGFDPSYLQEMEANQKQSTVYDTSLPTVEELFGNRNQADMTTEQWNEYVDLTDLLQETLDESQKNINEIVLRALQMEDRLFKLNKPKILGYIYKALSIVYGISTRVGRAAYCTYSHIPELNVSLHNIYDGVDCYTYTTGLVLKIQHQTVDTVKTIRRNVFDLAAIYKQVASKNSLVGKLTTIVLNVTKIARNILQSYSTAVQAMDSLQNELPGAAMSSVRCGSDFVTTLPHMIETASNVTTCIMFVDDATEDYDFMKPEDERDNEPLDGYEMK